MTSAADADAWQPPIPPPGGVRRMLAAELRLEWRPIALAVALVFLAGGAIVAGPSLIRRAIDDGVSAGDSGIVKTSAIVYLAVLAGGGIAGGLRTLLMTASGERMLHRLRVRAMAGVLKLDIASFERSRRGDITARITADVEVLSTASRWLVPELVRVVVTLLAALVALAVLSPAIMLVSLVVVPPIAYAASRFHRESNVIYPEYRRRVGAIAGLVVETLEATSTVQAYRLERRQLDSLDRGNRDVTDIFITASGAQNRLSSALTIAQAVGIATVVVTASTLVLNGNLTVGTAAAGIFAVRAMYEPLTALTEMLNYLLAAKAALARVTGLALLQNPVGGDHDLPTAGSLEFLDVDFSYVAGRKVLDDITFTVHPGQRVALVGDTGSGKSTIARLAVAFAPPDSGRVSVGGVDLAATTIETRRKALTLIPQEPYLIAGTIADNARLADPTITDDTIAAAAEQLGLHTWLATLPDGLATVVGHAGHRFSAGQQQLITLLRAVLADPAVLVLDEATSILDPASEELLSASLDRATADRAVLIIAHRMATAQRCDHVIVLHEGRIVETGTPAELTANGGRFAQMRHASDRA